AGALQTAKGAGATSDAFVAKLNAAGAALAYATYLGGSLADTGGGIAVDPAGAAYVTGGTASDNFPVASPFQPARAGSGPDADAFVAKLAPSGASLAYSTYLGGTDTENGRTIAVDSTGGAWVGGLTTGETFPAVRPVARFTGNQDAFVSRLSPDGTTLVFSTPYGGLGSDVVQGIAVDAEQNVYTGGLTSFARVPDYFPTINAFQTTFGGGFTPGTPNSGDGFVAKFAPDTGAAPVVTRLTPRSGDNLGGATVIIDGTGFTGATAVTFGTAPAGGYTVESDQRIAATSPPLATGIVKVVVTTPAGTTPANPVNEFFTGEGSWSLTGEMTTSRWTHSTTLLPGGEVLVAGGRVTQGSNAFAGAERYNPVTETFTLTGSMAQARWSHSATLLPSGKVLVAGGLHQVSGTSTALASAELYDPAAGAWAPAGTMNAARAVHAAVLVDGPGCGPHCGKVLVAGGRGTPATGGQASA
ncbi:MAG: SBBP repeat-containing protein, partial [Acidimicrobiales bacterium]